MDLVSHIAGRRRAADHSPQRAEVGIEHLIRPHLSPAQASSMRIRLIGEVSPVRMRTFVFATPSLSAINSRSASLALPFSGAAATFTFQVPSGILPASSVRGLFGITFTRK